MACHGTTRHCQHVQSKPYKMSQFLRYLAAALYRRPWPTIIAWLILIVIAAPLATRLDTRLTGGGFEASSSDSAAVARIVNAHFDDVAASQLAVVLVGDRDAPVSPETIDAAIAVLGDLGGVAPSSAFLAAMEHNVARTQGAVIIPLAIDPDADPTDVARTVRGAYGIRGPDATSIGDGHETVHVIGQSALFAAMQDLSTEQIQRAESRAFPLIALVLVLVFGSLVAALPPLLLAVAALVITSGLLYLLSGTIEISVFAASIVTLVGLGVAVDYSLFILARYRSEVDRGLSPATALEFTMRTSGKAVIFSGVTVIASMCGLFLVDSGALHSMAIGAILVVTVSILATITLLPSLIRVLGRRVYEPGRLSRLLGRFNARDHGSLWSSWARTVMKRPLVWMLVVTAVLIALALPGLSINLGNSMLRQFPESHEFRLGVDAATSVVGPGAFAPVRVIITDQANPHGPDVAAIKDELSARHDVVNVAPPSYSEGCGCVLVSAVLGTDPESDGARNAVREIDSDAEAASEASVLVGGVTAEIADFDDFVSGSMWKILLFVSLISLVVLIVLLRSLFLPIKAVFMNLLSIGVAYGVLVVTFQWGWFEWIGLESGPFIDTITPPLVLVIAYGLSMDYEVFLLSRMREIYDETQDNTTAVAEGIATSARAITSAALLMLIVFLAFVSAGIPTVQRVGLALAAAIAVDATLVRLIIVPSTMALLGRTNWWLPSSLARFLPRGAP